MIGSAKNAVIEGSATSHVELVGLLAHDVDIKIIAASTGIVDMDGTLNANLSAALKLRWIGKPIMGDIKTSGASELRKKE